MLAAGIGTGFVLLGGTALADSTKSSAVSTNETTTSVTISKQNSTLVQLDSGTHSDTMPTVTNARTTPEGAASGASSSSTSASSTSASAPDVGASTSNVNRQSVVDAIAAGDTVNLPTSPTVALVASSTSATSEVTAKAVAVHEAIARAVAQQFTSNYLPLQFGSSSSSSLAVPIQPVTESPREPKAPARSGALSAINQILASTLVPTIRQLAVQLPLDSLNFRSLAIVLTLSLGVICLYFACLSFAGLLRRTGYAHAARSDLVGSFFTFATPQAVSLYVATSPPLGSLFSGVQHKNSCKFN